MKFRLFGIHVKTDDCYTGPMHNHPDCPDLQDGMYKDGVTTYVQFTNAEAKATGVPECETCKHMKYGRKEQRERERRQMEAMTETIDAFFSDFGIEGVEIGGTTYETTHGQNKRENKT